MSKAPAPSRPDSPPRGEKSDRAGLFAALDLGTNNCRLLIASRSRTGFTVVEAFSRIVRLGEGLSRHGRLQDDAMNRAILALKICADKIKRRGVSRVRAVTTQACRSAANGPDFVARVSAETGLTLQVITPEEEARLSVAGCHELIDRRFEAALVLDVGGGSTELSFVRLGEDGRPKRDLEAWVSLPVGVVTLAERLPEPIGGDADAWFAAMRDHVRDQLEPFRGADALKPIFAAGRGHLVGTSGAITSLAGLHLGLARYDRNQVDGLWMSRADCAAASQKLLRLGPAGRTAEPCIGPDRADLVLGGAAILDAVLSLWPSESLRVADRGLREGLLLTMMNAGSRRRRRRGKRRADAA